MIGVTEGVVAKPLPVISNTVPLVALPGPETVVPKRLPLASATKLAPSPMLGGVTTMTGVLS